MIYSAILIAALTLLLSFLIERLSGALRFPAVAALIIAGIVGNPLLASIGITLAGLDQVVPVIGTLGLVLIVLDGALDIKLTRPALQAASMAFASALAGFVTCLLLFATLTMVLLDMDGFQACLLAVPFAVISSAVAIPSSQGLDAKMREFVVYESSLSDIVGVLVFFALASSDGSLVDVTRQLAGGGAISLILSVCCALALAYALMSIEGQVRHLPALAALFALYAIGKIYHLSPLLMVLLFGLAMNNPGWMTRLPFRREGISSEYAATLASFKSLATELTFAVRGFFFILLGYWTDLTALANPYAWLVAIVILTIIYSNRYVLLRIMKIESRDLLLWVAPRGLITVLLFINAGQLIHVPDYFNGAVLIVVIASALMVMLSRPVKAHQDT